MTDMLLDAEEYIPEPTHNTVPAWHFNAMNAHDMFALGYDTATFLEQLIEVSRRLQQPARIGLIGTCDVGKTTWALGLLSTLDNYELKEVNNTFRLQSVWKDSVSDQGWVRHYDANVRQGLSGDSTLKSYINNNISSYTMPLIDIVEHAHRDMHNKLFNALVNIEREKADSTRRVTYFVPPPHSNDENFKDMIARLSDKYGCTALGDTAEAKSFNAPEIIKLTALRGGAPI